jgi:hypothetical protein
MAVSRRSSNLKQDPPGGTYLWLEFRESPSVDRHQSPRRRFARTANRREALSAAPHVLVELTAGDEVALPKMGDHVSHCLVPRVLVIGRPCGRCSFG